MNGMKTVFIDTNIILDLLQKRPEYELAEKVFSGAAEGKYRIVTSTISMLNVAYVLGKVFRGEDLYAKLRSLKDILGVVSVSAEAYDNALSSSAKDIEDAVQLYSAQEGLSFCVVTRNKKDFIEGVLPVFTPSEFLQTTLL